MDPGTYNVELRTGVDFDLSLTWYQASSDTNPVDLTGYTGKAQIRDRAGNAVLTFQTTDDTMTLGGAAGTVAIHRGAADTVSLEPGAYDYDIVVTAPAGQKYTLLCGQALVVEGVTQ